LASLSPSSCRGIKIWIERNSFKNKKRKIGKCLVWVSLKFVAISDDAMLNIVKDSLAGSFWCFPLCVKWNAISMIYFKLVLNVINSPPHLLPIPSCLTAHNVLLNIENYIYVLSPFPPYVFFGFSLARLMSHMYNDENRIKMDFIFMFLCSEREDIFSFHIFIYYFPPHSLTHSLHGLRLFRWGKKTWVFNINLKCVQDFLDLIIAITSKWVVWSKIKFYIDRFYGQRKIIAV
jgi:hypothetical protein